jgi:hypothetical protein
MPKSPPTPLAMSDVKENIPNPNSETMYPPRQEPITIPIMITVFRDILRILFLIVNPLAAANIRSQDQPTF